MLTPAARGGRDPSEGREVVGGPAASEPHALASPRRRAAVSFASAVVAAAPAPTPTRRHARAEMARQVSSRFKMHVEMALQRREARPGWRSRALGAGPEAHEAARQEEGTAKSMEVFKGEAKDILHGIFLVLLLRFLVVLAAVLCAAGAAAALVLAVKDPSVPVMSYVAFWSAA